MIGIDAHWPAAKEYDVSDDEGDPASGRISPCTFRLLAEGCAKEEPKANQVYMADDVYLVWSLLSGC